MASQKLVRTMKGIGIWLPTVLLGLLFVMQGVMKLSGMPAWIERFRGYGYPDTAERMMVRLSDLLRISLEHTGRERVPLQSEIEFARLYAGIQQMRFGDRLTVDWKIDEKAIGSVYCSSMTSRWRASAFATCCSATTMSRSSENATPAMRRCARWKS